MKYERTPPFDRDVRRLKRAKRLDRFRKVVREDFLPAAERKVAKPGEPWPRRLPVKDVEGHPGIWEMTWEWPDGRATFEWMEVDGEPAIRWRRVGTHAIFREP